jgi:hypothetical protein
MLTGEGLPYREGAIPMPALRVTDPLTASPQQISDESGAVSPIYVSTNRVGISREDPAVALDIEGDLKLEYNGSPRLTLFSRGNGSQQYSLRATNDRDSAGGNRLVFRNEDAGRDLLFVDSAGNLTLERHSQSGSPSITLHSHGFGTQRYSIRVTNNADPGGGRRFVIRNEDQDVDVFVVDADSNITVQGDITLPGADCAERFITRGGTLEPGTVVVIDSQDRLRESTEPYDRRVAGIISGAAGRRPGLILGGGKARKDHQAVALSGTVVCKVDATLAPIDVGDLLTTAESAGHAMKAADRGRAFGAVLGKALRPFARGQGLVPVLVSLQ